MTDILLCATVRDGRRWLAERSRDLPLVTVTDALAGKGSVCEVIHFTPEARQHPDYGYAIVKLTKHLTVRGQQ